MATFGDAKTNWLARVNVLGGKGDSPCYRAELRGAFRLQQVKTDQVVQETVALRSLAMSTTPQTVHLDRVDFDPAGNVPLHTPFLLRLHAAALAGMGDTLEINGKLGTLLPLAGQDYGDLLISPAVAKWPSQEDPDPDSDYDADDDGAEISVPSFRIHGGETQVMLKLDSSKLCRLLRATEKSLFGGLVPVTTDKKSLPISLVAEGVEFAGSLPDPTRSYGAADDARISGRFRLEYDPRRADGGYLLRLVAEAGADALEARIGAAFADLALESASPLAISLDRRPVVPSLLWPLVLKDNSLSLIPAGGSPADFEMEIDRKAVTVRLRTSSNYPGEAPALAAVLVDRIGWIKTAAGFDVRVMAGALKADQLSLAFAKNEDQAWTTTFATTTSGQPVVVPLYEHAQRMLGLYHDARAKAAADKHAGYLYFPLAQGWLQLGLPREKSTPAALPAAPPKAASVLSGRLVAGSGGAGRGVSINDARALALTMHWKLADGKVRARDGTLLLSGTHAVLRGFLFAAETSPTAVEALPDLRRGPAATREMPIHIGAGPQRLALSGKFTWHADKNDWTLDVDGIDGNNLDTDHDYPPKHYAWLPAAPNPFVSNHPLTRSVASATEPSPSRGLLPVHFGQAFALRLENGAAMPRLQAAGALAWQGVFGDSGATFRGDTLLLPTLAGIEFYPRVPGEPAAVDAALRFDVPLLDELFAWSDPPPESAEKAEIPPGSSLAVTSLDMPELQKVWDTNRTRLALTRTQAAFASPWQAVGKAATIAVGGLVEPYTWMTQFRVDIGSYPYGQYSLGGVDYTPQRAVGGLDKVRFAPKGIRLDQDGAGPIAVAGFAAGLFELEGRHWDSRGFGVAAEATAAGRQASYRSIEKGKLVHTDFALFTMPDALTFSHDKVTAAGAVTLGFTADLQFYVRDLALTGGVFNGLASPIESAPGMTGQAFLPAVLPAALHEWRFFEKPGKSGLRRHDIGYGPFRFKPLRLLHAAFDPEGVPALVRIVGSMRLDLDPALSQEAAKPFGPDEVYRGGDLFELTLTYVAATGAWQHAWRAVATEPDPTTGLLKFETRSDNGVSCAVLLEPAPSGIASNDAVPATVVFDLTGGSATLYARLFGNSTTLKCAKFAVSTDGIDLAFPASAPVAHAPREHGVWLVGVQTSVLIRKTGSTLQIDGSLVVMAAGATVPSPDAALAVFGTAEWRWLDLAGAIDGKQESSMLTVDHRSGVLRARWKAKGSGAPLFGLVHTEFTAAGEITAIAASVAITENHTRIGMASAWMRVFSIADGGRSMLDHRLLADPQGAQHVLDISGDVDVNSPIRWPLDGISKEGGAPLALDPGNDPWLDPGQGKAPLTPLSRVISIAADAPAARHQLTLRLKRHGIAAAQLVRKNGRVTVAEPVRLLGVAEHRLVHGKRSAAWTSLDYVTITTAGAMLAATAVDPKTEKRWYYFAPRYRHGYYRGAKASTIRRPSILPMSLALAGFHDPCMVENLWRKMPQDQAIIVGGATLQLRLERGGPSLLTVMAWMHLPGIAVELTQCGGTWRAPAVELWSSHALANMEALPAIGLSTGLDAPTVAQRFQAAGLSAPSKGQPMADVLPVEQAWFEKWKDKKAVPMDPADLGGAPFFLRTLLVLARRWQADTRQDKGGAVTWDVATLHPCRTDAGRASLNNEGPAVFRVEIRADTPWQSPYREAVTLVPADLVVLSRARATTVHSYRLIAQTSTIESSSVKRNAVLVERALDEDSGAMVAIQETVNAAGEPAILISGVPKRLDDWLAGPGAQVRALPELSPSATLGWPSPVGLTGLQRMAPRLRGELPVLAPQAGFSARFQRFGWPALAARAGQNDQVHAAAPAPEAYYVSFANHVAYDRDTALTFDGPPARHLMPAPVRRRAPVGSSVQGALELLAGAPTATDPVPLPEPMLLPGIERVTIGRRPGVFEVAVASLTIPADEGAFDPDYARFGRPASSGPVAAHQLRTPRSPLLPGDADDDAIAALTKSSPLAFRRRTYLSEADRDDEGHFTLFKTFAGNVDVMRFGSGSSQVRVAFKVVRGALIGPNWNGRIDLAIDARKGDGTSGDNKVAGLRLERDARLEIGSRTFILTPTDKPGIGAAFGWECDRLIEAREMLRTASADTPIRLVAGVRPAADPIDTATGLPPAAVRLCTIRLALDPGLRSVLAVGTSTIAFGDPSYDRQLASPTQAAPKELENAQRILLAADRKRYDIASALYLAFGPTDRNSGLFMNEGGAYTPRLRITYSRAGSDDINPIDGATLLLRGAVNDKDMRYKLTRGEPYAIALSQLYRPEDAAGRAALAPGDRLTLSVMYEGPQDKKAGKELVIAVDIVAEPVVAPAPSVYSVIGADAARKVMSVVLHAAAPLPQRIEFEDLARDLALGHVRRRGLFIWSWAAAHSDISTADLVKVDRSGGAQLPLPFTP